MMMLTESFLMQNRNSNVEDAVYPPRKCGQTDVASLLAHVAQRDVEALGELYRVCAPTLLGVAMRVTRKREWAEDVLQDGFIKIWRFARSYDPDRSSAMTWMATIVKNQALDHLRRLPSMDELPVDFEADSEFENDWPDAVLQRTTDIAHLCATLQQLNPMQRQAIALAYFRGQSHAEVACTLNVPVGTAKSWIRRALNLLKVQLEGTTAPTSTADYSSGPKAGDINAVRVDAKICAQSLDPRGESRGYSVH
jgi:RNA polymerase sigma-70 factor (ECF subfamily)